MTKAGDATDRPRASRGSLLLSTGAAAILLVLFFGVMEASLREKSITFDELAHLTAGYSYWQYGDYRFQPENGILPQRLEALPLFCLGSYSFPPIESANWKKADEWSFGYQWLYRQGHDARRMLAWGRGAAGLVTVALGALIWGWSRHLFGARAGMLSLLLYLLNPNILANGALMTSDLSSSFFMLAALAGWLWLRDKPSLGRSCVSAVLLGCALVAKASGILLLPVFALIFAAELILPQENAQARTRRLVIGAAVLPLYAGIVLVVVWAFYGFRYAAFSPALASGAQLSIPWEILLGMPSAHSWPGAAVSFARDWQLLPEGYLYGLLYVADFSQYRSAFLNGAVGLRGWTEFFPYAFAVKNPLPVLGILAWGGTLIVRHFFQAKDKLSSEAENQKRFETGALVLFAAVYGGMALLSHLNIGQRHLLPLYGPLFILCGVIARDRAPSSGEDRWNRRRSFVLAGLLAVTAVEAMVWYPNYLAYFNLLAGGERGGYRHLVDSSLDWGQDLPGAARYIREHPEEKPFYLSYFGNGSPTYEGVAACLLYSVPGWDAVPLIEFPAPAGNPTASPAPDGYESIHLPSSSSTGGQVWLRKPTGLRLEGGTYLISATMLQPVLYPPQDGPWGHWNWRDESVYQDLQAQVSPLFNETAGARAPLLSARSPAAWNALWARFEEFRFARLTAFLRQREPAARIGGGTVLVYRLSEREVGQAIEGPPAEMEPDPRWSNAAQDDARRISFNEPGASLSPVPRSAASSIGP